MGLVVGIYSMIGGLVIGLILAGIIARHSEGATSSIVNFLGAAYFTVPASTAATFFAAFWMITGKPPFDLFGSRSRPDYDIPPVSSARDYTKYYLDGQIKIKGKRTEGEFGSFFGPLNAWYFNGQKAYERIYDEQKPLSDFRERQWTEWYENGLKKGQRLTMPNQYEEVEGPYHDRITQWYENGQKYTEGDARHGAFVRGDSFVGWLGSQKEWYPSGQLKCEWYEKNRGVKAWYESGKPLYETLDPGLNSKGRFWDEQGNVSERHKPKEVCPRSRINYLTEAHLAEDHPFEGSWKSNTELTLDYALENSDLSEEDIRTIRRVTGKDVLEIGRHEVTVNYQGYSVPSPFRVVSKEDDLFKIKYTYEILSADGVHEHVSVSDNEFYINLPDEVWIDYSFFSEVIPLDRLYFSRVKSE